MQSVSLIELVYELHRGGMSPDEIAKKVGKHRATVFRWLRQIKRRGILSFLRRYKAAKTGRRQKRKTQTINKLRVLEIRKKYHNCCGEKIQYWMMKTYSTKIGLSTIYRILNEKYRLRGKCTKNMKRGPIPHASKPREVVQTDTVLFGDLFAFTSVDIFTREAQVVIKTALDSTAGSEAIEEQMKFFGFADMIQRDGGPEFKLHWEEQAKQYCHRIRTARPYRKNEQSFIESFNRTLRKECLGWMNYKKKHLSIVKQRVQDFLQFYNNERPHLSLSMKSPRPYFIEKSHLR
jgi:transposase